MPTPPPPLPRGPTQRSKAREPRWRGTWRRLKRPPLLQRTTLRPRSKGNSRSSSVCRKKSRPRKSVAVSQRIKQRLKLWRWKWCVFGNPRRAQRGWRPRRPRPKPRPPRRRQRLLKWPKQLRPGVLGPRKSGRRQLRLPRRLKRRIDCVNCG